MDCEFDTLFYDESQHNFYEKITKKANTFYRLLPWHGMKLTYKPKKNCFMVVYQNLYFTIKLIPLDVTTPSKSKDDADPIGLKIRSPTVDRF
jgi:hypothetical protein